MKSEVLVYSPGHRPRTGWLVRAGSFGHADRVDIRVLRRLSDPTGGRSYLLEDAHRGGIDLIDQALVEISEELRQ